VGGTTRDWLGGKVAIALHFDLCPSSRAADVEDSPARAFTLESWLNRVSLQHVQVSLELMVAPVKLYLDSDTLAGLRRMRDRGLPFRERIVARSRFGHLRYLAACRRAYNIPSHVEMILRERSAINVAVTMEGVEIQLGVQSGLETRSVFVEVKDVQLLRGVFLTVLRPGFALGPLEHGNLFLLPHAFVPASAAVLPVLEAPASQFVERTWFRASACCIRVSKHNHGEPSEHSLLGRRADVEVLASSCIVPGHPGHPALRVDVNVSPVELRLSATRLEVLLVVYRGCSGLRGAGSSGAAISSTVGDPPRLALLSDLIQLQLELSVQRLDIGYFDENCAQYGVGEGDPTGGEAAILADVARSLMHYGEPGNPSEAVRRLALSRLLAQGYTCASAEAAFHGLLGEFRDQSFLDKDISLYEKHDRVEARAWADSFTAEVAQRLAGLLKRELGLQPAFTLLSTSIYCGILRLTYDFRASVELGEAHFREGTSVPILDLLMKEVPASSRDDKTKRAARATPGVATAFTIESEAAVVAARASDRQALSLILTEQDSDASWGRGGLPASFLRESGGSKSLHRGRDRHMAVTVNKIATVFSPSTWDKILQSLMGDLVRVHSNIVTFLGCIKAGDLPDSCTHGQARPDVASPAVQESMSISVGLVEAILCEAWQPYAGMTAEGLQLQSDWTRSESQCLLVTVGSYALVDLTPGGEDHPTVITRDTGDGEALRHPSRWPMCRQLRLLMRHASPFRPGTRGCASRTAI
jgi:hypothetical protein